MAETDLLLELDLASDRRRFMPGETIRGALGGVALAAGESRTLPFELTLPESVPLSYAGTLLDLMWTLDVRAQSGWTLNGTASVAVELVPDPRAPLVVRCVEVRSVDRARLLGWGLLLLFLVTSCALTLLLAPLVSNNLLLLALLLIGFGALQQWPRQVTYRSYAPGDVSVALVTEGGGYRDAGTREVLECVVRSHGHVPLKQATATLRVHEVVLHGLGDAKSRQQHERYRLAAPLTREGHDWVARIELPTSGVPLYSIDLVDNRLAWDVSFDLDIPKWPNMQHTVGLSVHSERQPASIT